MNSISKTQRTFTFVILTTIAALLFFTIKAIAQDNSLPPSQTEWTAFFDSLKGLGGMKAAAIILVAVQGIMLVVRQFIQGKWKLLIVSALTFVAAIIGGFASGQPIMSALLSGGALLSLQVFISQIVLQFQKKEV